MSRSLRALAIAACTTSCLAGSGCGSGTATPPATVVTVTAPAPSAAAPSGTTTPPTAPAAPTEGMTPPAPRKRVPDVVGMNLQAAQDHLQAAGFYVLNDKDATGQNRLQVMDRNWEVVRQDPAAGKRVSTDTLITLYAKKIGE